jgi:hypothetical protein
MVPELLETESVSRELISSYLQNLPSFRCPALIIRIVKLELGFWHYHLEIILA